jgi:hypothetical protein
MSSLCLPRIVTFGVALLGSVALPTAASAQVGPAAPEFLGADLVRTGALDPLAPADRAGFAEALERAVHTVRADASGRLVARNPRQAWSLEFGREALSVRPDSGAFAWGLELRAFGRVGSIAGVDGTRSILTANEGRVERALGAGLTEWYVNDARGLEHGYTLDERPSGATGAALSFTIDVKGDLRPDVSTDGRDVTFVDGDGAARLDYDGLVAFDRDGDLLPAHFTATAAGDLVLVVDDAGADYPITIDPIAEQQAYLKASNAGAEDNFGFSCSVQGTTVVIGAPVEGSEATGIGGDETSDNAGTSGAVYVLSVVAGVWTQEEYIKASNTDVDDRFGWAVCLDGDTLVVGAPTEDGGATGVNGNDANNGAKDAGAAYVFVRNAGVWSQQAYLKASNTDAFDSFGTSVAIVGDTIAVGAPFEDSAGLGVRPAQGNNGLGFDSGAAYVFTRNGGVWSQQAYLKASNTGGGDQFGTALAMSGETLVVGAPFEDGDGSMRANNAAADAGAAYAFVRNGGAWSQEAYLKSSAADAGDEFGAAVALQDDSLVVGAPGEDGSGTGVGGNRADNGTSNSGAAYLFSRSGGAWTQDIYIKASNTGVDDRFGSAVAIDLVYDVDLVPDPDLDVMTILVGAPFEKSSATGCDGNQGDDSLLQAGAMYAFRAAFGSPLEQIAYVKASNTGIGDRYGSSVCLDRSVVVVGAPIEASEGMGIDANQDLNRAGGAGAAYGVDLPLPPPPKEPEVFVCEGGSVLIYPYIRSSLGDANVFTVVSVTNIARGGDCTTDVHFQYVNVGPSPSPFIFADCSISDRIETLTPADTLSVLTSCHNGASGTGYLVVSAMDPNQVDTYWSFNHLIGSEQVISPQGGVYALRPWDFCSLVADKQPSDLNFDGCRNFDGIEYEGMPDELYLDTFVGNAPGELILISMTGGQYLTQVDFIIFNDNEYQLSAQFAFSCWTRTPLAEISGFFTTAGLKTTPTDPNQLDLNCDTLADAHTGWAIIRPKRALSITDDNIDDPAVIGAITNDSGQYTGARLLWESVQKQTNGKFPH